MAIMRFLLAGILPLLLSPVINAHGLSPSRLEAESGSKLVAYRFTAINNYDQWEQFAVQCFKGDLKHPYECKSFPSTFYVPPKKTRTFKAQIETDGDGLYMVCTIQVKEAPVISRVCANFGVGVSANSNRVNQSTKHSKLPTGAR